MTYKECKKLVLAEKLSVIFKIPQEVKTQLFTLAFPMAQTTKLSTIHTDHYGHEQLFP